MIRIKGLESNQARLEWEDQTGAGVLQETYLEEDKLQFREHLRCLHKLTFCL